MVRRPGLTWALLGVALCCLPGELVAQDGTRTIRVYSALSQEHLSRYGEAFNGAHPEIRISWERAPTGAITERVLAERSSPEADAIFGLAATSMEQLSRAGALAPFSPVGLDRLSLPFRDIQEPPAWVGMNAWIGAVCVNTVELSARKLPAPVSWRELGGNIYRELVAMPSPVSSGTGFLNVSGWIQIMGEELAWSFMERLHKNVVHYTAGGADPCNMASRGEVAIGISFAHRGVRSLQQGAPVQILLPREGVGWDVGASAVLAGARDEGAARILVEWAISEAANELYNESYAMVGVQDVTRQVTDLPSGIFAAMIQNDLHWASDNRARILEEWARRFAPPQPAEAAEGEGETAQDKPASQ